MERIALVVWLSMCWASSSLATNWPQFRGPNRDGVSDERGWFKAGVAAKTVWEHAVGAGYSSVAIQGDRLFTMGNRNGQDSVVCLNATTGDELWRHTYASKAGSYPGPRCTPTLDGARVFTLSREGLLLCLDAAKGDVVWQRDLVADMSVDLPQWGAAGSPLVAGDLLVVNIGSHGLAVDKATGKTRWASGGTGAGYASPVRFQCAGVPAVLLFAAKAVVAADLAIGNTLWSYAWNTSYDVNAADPLVVDGNVLISSGYGRGGALLDVSGVQPKVVWENKSLASHFSTPVRAGTLLFGISGNTGKGELRCVDLTTGAIKWGNKATGFGSLILADGKLLVLNEKGILSVVEAAADACRELWSQSILDGVCWTMPVLCNGLIYCRNDKGRLICLDLRGE